MMIMNSDNIRPHVRHRGCLYNFINDDRDSLAYKELDRVRR
ncbi:hypothetical protein [Paenibacillus agricola]|nr:hypothetical protein [Paenibacillus agricola]